MCTTIPTEQEEHHHQHDMQASAAVTIRAKGKGVGEMDKYPAKSHAHRVADKLKMDNGLVLIQGASLHYYPDTDMPIPFRQDRAFYYLTGCNEPGCYLTYETAKDKLTLWLPKAGEGRRIFYDGRNITPKEAMERYDVDDVKVVNGPAPKKTNLRKALLDHYEDGGEFAFFKLPGHLMGKPLRQKLKSRRKTGLRPAIKQCRLIKDAHEIELIRKANDVTAKAHQQVMHRLHALKSEPQAMAVYLRTCLVNHVQEQSYAPIIGAGSSSAQLHYVKNDQPFGKHSQVLLIDAGAEYKCYASDVTRTLPLNFANPGHWPSKEAEAVYKAVENIQEECIKQLAPGKKFIDVAWHAVHMAIDALLEMGVLKGDHMEIFHAGTVLAFFPHGLGHHLGLDVHDGMAPPKDDENKGKKGKDGKDNGGKDGDGKKGGANKVGSKKNDEWTLVENEVLFDAANEKDSSTSEIDEGSEKEPLLNESVVENASPAGVNGAASKKNNSTPPKDPRFERIGAIYRSFAPAGTSFAPLRSNQRPMHYSLNAANCYGPATPQAPPLKAGMVVTIEPGLYFNRFILNRQFLNNDKHKDFIDEKVLERYLPVGGVRIEDDVLITKDGYENLTTAAKGDEMLKLIKDGAKDKGNGDK